MSDWAVYKLQPGFDGPLSDFLDFFREFNSFDAGIGSEFKINAVGIVISPLKFLFLLYLKQIFVARELN